MTPKRPLGLALATAVFSAPLLADPVPLAQWKFDEFNSGSDQISAWDVHPNENPLRLRNGATYVDLHSTGPLKGPSGEASDRYLTLPSMNSHGYLANPAAQAAWQNLGAFTISGWIKVPAVPYGSSRWLLHWSGTEEVELWFPWSAGQAQLRVGGVTVASATVLTSSDVDKWVFVAVTYTAGRSAAQNDGVKFYKGHANAPAQLLLQAGDTSATGAIVNTGGNLYVGNTKNLDRAFPGSIDNLRIDATALSLAQLEEQRRTYAAKPGELLVNPDFETNTNASGSWNAYGWWHEAHNPASPVIKYNYVHETVAAGPHGVPTRAQKVEVTVPSDEHRHIYMQERRLRAGQIYEASIWIKALASPSNPYRGCFLMREATANGQFAKAMRTFTLTDSNWHKLSIVGGSETDAVVYFGIRTLNTAVPQKDVYDRTYWVDEASLVESPGQAPGVPEPLDLGPVPGSFFGVHFNAGNHPVWPLMQQKTVRLWDSGTRWGDLEWPTKGNWQPPGWGIQSLNNRVNQAFDSTSNPAVIYTLGMPPSWAVADNAHDVSPYGHAFTSLPPDKLEDWTDYVGTVARHPANYAVPTDSRNQTRRIKYWEIWNETTNSGPVGANYVFYRGTTAQLVELTKQARDVLKDIWTGHQIVAPNILTLEGLEAFLSNNTAAYGKPNRGGGGQYVDIFSLHAYDHISLPEAQRPYVAAYRDVLGRFPSQTLGKPLWNTEGADLLPGAAPSDESAGIVSRKFISQWVDGISNFNWYAWDIFWYSSHGLGTDPRATSGDGLQLTANGVAYRETYKWMVGATAVSRTITPSGTGGERWAVELKRPGSYRGWIVWDTGAYTPVNWTIPGAYTGVTTLRRLNATSSATSPGATIQIGVSPVLIEGGKGPVLAYHFDGSGSAAAATTDAVVATALTLRAGTSATDLHVAGVGPWAHASDRVIRTGTGAMASGNRNAYLAGTTALNGKQKFTITGWLRTNNLAGNKIGNGAHLVTVGTQIKLSSQLAASGRLDLTVNGTGGVSTANDFIPEIGQWVFFAVTYDSTLPSGNVKFYRGTPTVSVADPVGVTYTGADALNSSGGAVYIGNSGNLDRAFGGDLDRITVHDVVLTKAEIESLRSY